MVWRAWTEQEQAAFWSRYRAGSSLRSIGQALGHSMQTLRTLMKATGGRQPVVPRRSARCLSLGEREEISRGQVSLHAQEVGILAERLAAIEDVLGPRMQERWG